MSGIEREAMGNIWHLCEQMAYTAQQGHIETLRAQYSTLSKYMQRLEVLDDVFRLTKGEGRL